MATRRVTITYYAGLDVSLREISVCVIDEGGTIVTRDTIPADPMAVNGWFKNRKLCPKIIVHESGQLSI
jgi:transposase